MRFFSLLWSICFGSVLSILAQNVTDCPSGGVCYAVNVPASTASTGIGDIYFQLSGPSSLSWIGLGQATSMLRANLFMVYANSAGNNVTISPRLGIGESQLQTGSTTYLTLLDGSGISNGMITANVRYSNCNSWSGGSMSFTDANSNWIFAYKTGSSDSVDVPVAMHSTYGSITFSLQHAAGGSTLNPFESTAAAMSPSGSSSGSSSSSSGGGGSFLSNFKAFLIAHAVLAPVAFVLFFPLGAISTRLMSFKGLIWFHAGWMIFTCMIVLASMGMGIWIAVTINLLDSYHAIIGLVVVGCLLLQPVTVLVNHLLYKKRGRPNMATYPHMVGPGGHHAGIINGGFGLSLADNTKGGTIAYGVVAGVMWILWMAVILIAFIRSRGKPEGETGEAVFGNTTATRRCDNPSL